jgi:hypothetical protein
MKIIRCNKDESSIKVSIKIDGIELWKYSYIADEPFNNSEKQQKLPEHELGITKNLDRDSNYWKIYLANPYDETRKVKVSIKWFEDGNEIADWTPDEAGKDGKVVLKANSGIEISDSSYFIKS